MGADRVGARPGPLLATLFIAGCILSAKGASTARAQSPIEPVLPADFSATRTDDPPSVADVVDEEELLFDPGRLREIRIDFETNNWQQLLARNRNQGEVDAHARLEIDGHTLEDIGIRYKGNTSLSVDGPKKPFNLTIDAFVPGQELLGYDVINLNNGWGDPTMLREAAAYTLLRDFMPIPQASFAQVWINDRYIGVYLMVEQIERTFLEAWFPTTDGLLIKADNPADTQLESSTLDYTADLERYRRGYELKGDVPDEDAAFARLQELTLALDGPQSRGGLSRSELEQGIRPHLDVDSALWYLAANSVLANYDSYYAGHNYYLYQGRRSSQFHLLNWDWNLSFGTFQSWFGSLISPNAPPVALTEPFDQSERGDRPLTRRLMDVPAYRADYIAYYRSLRDQVLAPAHLSEVALAYQDLIREAARAETYGIYSFEEFERNLRQDIVFEQRRGPRTIRQVTPGLLSVAGARYAFLSDVERQPELSTPDLQLLEQGVKPSQPSFTDPVEVAAVFKGAQVPAAVELRYRVRGGAQQRMAMRSSEDGSWRAEIPPQAPGRKVTYVIRAETNDGRAVFFPAPTLTAAFRYDVAGFVLPERLGGDLVINELMADNETTHADQGGAFEDWVEILNRGAMPVDLEAYFLSDMAGRPWDYPLPATTLAPGERLLIWCDNAPEEGPDHAPFRLSRQGESLVLTSRDAILDIVDYGPQSDDISWGRRLDGEEDWKACQRPTPGGANDCRYAGWPIFLPRLGR